MRVFLCLAVLVLASAAAAAQPNPIMPQDTKTVPTSVSNLVVIKGPLEIYQIYTNPEPPVPAGQSIFVYYRVRNRGPGDFAGSFDARLRVTGAITHETEKRVDVPNLSAGEDSDNFFGPLTAPAAGQYEISVEITYKIGSEVFGDKKSITVEVGPQTPLESSDDKGGQPLQKLMVIIVIVFVILMVVGVVFIYAMSHRKKKAVAGPLPAAGPSLDAELEVLYQKKAEIESMIKIAKIKYYKRKMDEESYKEIMKKNEERLIEVEAKINEMAGRVKRLEEAKGQKK